LQRADSQISLPRLSLLTIHLANQLEPQRFHVENARALVVSADDSDVVDGIQHATKYVMQEK
jgi:hypothetical protein